MKSNLLHLVATGVFAIIFDMTGIVRCAEPINQVLSLNGTDAYVSVPSAPELQNPDEMTVEAWIYPRQADQNNSVFVNKSDNAAATTSRSYELQWVADADSAGPGQSVRFVLFLADGGWTFLDAPAAENTWVHVAAAFSSSEGTLKLYTNGVLAKVTEDASGTPLSGASLRQTTLPVRFGRGEYPPYFYANGYMDEIRIWSAVRTHNEIAASRFCRLTGAETNLAGYWNFDDGTATDLTSHENDGAFIGGAGLISDIVHQGICGGPYFDTTALGFSVTTGFQQRILGPAGASLRVDTSTNLIDWYPFLTLPDFSGDLEFSDSSTIDLRQRFYRIVLP